LPSIHRFSKLYAGDFSVMGRLGTQPVARAQTQSTAQVTVAVARPAEPEIAEPLLIRLAVPRGQGGTLAASTGRALWRQISRAWSSTMLSNNAEDA
jgi:hypothetical protein